MVWDIVIFFFFWVVFFFFFFVFFFNDTATTEIYTLSLHDALPIYGTEFVIKFSTQGHIIHDIKSSPFARIHPLGTYIRSEEHTSELQSRQYIVCRLLLEKKKHNKKKKKKNLIILLRTTTVYTSTISVHLYTDFDTL